MSLTDLNKREGSQFEYFMCITSELVTRWTVKLFFFLSKGGTVRVM